MSVDPDLLALWTRGWALTRGAASPISDGGGWRIEVGQPDQLRRFVFAAPGAGVARRADQIHEPALLIKVCAEEEVVRRLVPDRFQVRRTGWFMRRIGQMAPMRRLPHYRPERTRSGEVLHLTFHAGEEEAARGRGVRVDDAVIFDRIAVEPQHRRRGLGGMIMHGLQTELAGPGPFLGLLAATDEGRALYESLGWEVLSPYVTAQIPATDRG